MAANSYSASIPARHSGVVKISVDREWLRLQFPVYVSQHFYGKRQLFKGLGRQNNKENRKWAERIASLIQADLDHPNWESLFDPSLAKYLGIGAAAPSNVLIHPAQQQTKLKDIWQDYIEYKFKSGKISETTYRTRYKRTFSNWIAPYIDEPVSQELAERISSELLASQVNRANLKKLLTALKEACDRAINQGIITRNYFINIGEGIKLPSKSKQLLQEEDFRAFSKQERDTIIKAFRESEVDGEARIADLVEFLFLTGCRLGEAFALKWSDIKRDWIVFDESYSSETKITKCTKTDTIRIFRSKGYTKLQNLLKLLSERHKFSSNDFVFQTLSGKQYDRFKLSALWLGIDKSKAGTKYYYPGVVTRLARENKISGYLKPSATRHTFITIQSHAGVDLKLLADSVGNSVDVIYNHYLGVDKDAKIEDI